MPFLNAIHREAVCESTDSDSVSGPTSSVTIFAHAHLGLSSYVGVDGDGTFTFPEPSCVTLPAQIQAHVEFLDEILVAYGPATRVLLVGHSIGAWFVQEVLKARASLRPRVGAYMLFPTLSDIAKTPGGRMLWVRVCMCRFGFDLASNTLARPCGASLHPLPTATFSTLALKPVFRPPLPRTLAYLSLLVRHAPLFIHRLAQPSWPVSQLQVLRSFLHAPAAIYASLTMAHDELDTVRDLDTDFLREFAENLWFYYADEDDWVGDQRGVVLRALQGTAAESHVVHDHGGVPHAFCISAAFFSSSW